jgi:hypothetical protein
MLKTDEPGSLLNEAWQTLEIERFQSPGLPPRFMLLRKGFEL